MIKMGNKIMLFFGIFLILSLSVGVSAFDYSEDDEGNAFLETEDKVIAPQITIRDLVTLQPSVEPANPEIGTIYFDSASGRLKLYDGSGWYAFALEKVSSVSKKQVKERVEENDKIKSCSESIECGDWGDCINNYQSMICVSVSEDCNKYEDTETRDCVSDFKLESAAKESHDVDVVSEEEIAEEEVSEEVSEEEVVAEEGVESEEEGVEEEVVEEEVVEEELEVAEEVPEELFDITFDLEENSLGGSDKLVVWVTLQNFGKRYVPARIIYGVSDVEGEEVYREFEEIRVYTDQSIIKRFDNLVLEEGDYVLSMRVEYAGIVEEFSGGFVVETGLWAGIKRFFGGWF